MANLRDIRRRIKSVRNTSQITKAMQMVSSAKMRRAQEQAVRGRDYLAAIAEVLYHLKDEIKEQSNVLLKPNDSTRELVLVVNTDRGLCGGLNMNLFKAIRAEVPADAHFVTIGQKLNPTFARTGMRIEATWSLNDPLALVELKPVIDLIRQKFREGAYGKVTVAYSAFVNTMVQKPVIRQLLPVQTDEILAVAETGAKDVEEGEAEHSFVLEPNRAELLDAIIPLYVFYVLVQMVLEARASEHSARMVSMKAATENALGLIDDLTLEYNKARQTQITNELLEITTAMRAME